VGNPSLCPAFRVRRGSDREYGFVSGRARRATRPTPSEFRRPCGHGADFSRRRACWGIARRPPRPALSRPRQSLGTRSESGEDADVTDRRGRGAQGATESSADARDPMTRPTSAQPHPPVPASAGRPIMAERAVPKAGFPDSRRSLEFAVSPTRHPAAATASISTFNSPACTAVKRGRQPLAASPVVDPAPLPVRDQASPYSTGVAKSSQIT